MRSTLDILAKNVSCHLTEHSQRKTSTHTFLSKFPFPKERELNRGTVVVIFCRICVLKFGHTLSLRHFARTAETRILPYQELRFLSLSTQFLVGKKRHNTNTFKSFLLHPGLIGNYAHSWLGLFLLKAFEYTLCFFSFCVSVAEIEVETSQLL